MTRRDTTSVHVYTKVSCLDCLARLVLKIDAINVRGTLLGSFFLRPQRLSEAIATIWVRF